MGTVTRQGSCGHIGDGCNVPANIVMETVDQMEVVDTAMCFTLLAGCRCWFSGLSAGMLYYLSFVMNGKRRIYPICANAKCSKWNGEFKNAPKTPKKPPPPLDPCPHRGVRGPEMD